MAYHRYHGLEVRIVRIFNTYGPRMRLRDGRVVPAFIQQALLGQPLTVFGAGTQTALSAPSTTGRGLRRPLGRDIDTPANTAIRRK